MGCFGRGRTCKCVALGLPFMKVEHIDLICTHPSYANIIKIEPEYL